MACGEPELPGGGARGCARHCGQPHAAAAAAAAEGDWVGGGGEAVEGGPEVASEAPGAAMVGERIGRPARAAAVALTLMAGAAVLRGAGAGATGGGACTWECADGSRPVPRVAGERGDAARVRCLGVAGEGGASQGGSAGVLSPYSFDRCCEDHGQCYGVCGSDRSACDRKLSQCLTKLCTRVLPGHKKRACKADAAEYALVVADSGCDAYQESQQATCACGEGGGARDEIEEHVMLGQAQPQQGAQVDKEGAPTGVGMEDEEELDEGIPSSDEPSPPATPPPPTRTLSAEDLSEDPDLHDEL